MLAERLQKAAARVQRLTPRFLDFQQGLEAKKRGDAKQATGEPKFDFAHIPLVGKIRWNGVLAGRRVDAELVKLKRRERFHVAVRKPAIGFAAVPGVDVCAGSRKGMELLGG